jgi:hypothetical protein
MDTTIWVAIIVATSTLLASLGATWLSNLHSNKRFRIELGRAIDVDQRTRKWLVRSALLFQLREELAEMDLWGKRLVETSNNKLINLNPEAVLKLGTLIQSGKIELTLNAIGDRDLEEKTLNSIHSYVEAYYFVKGLPETHSMDKLTEVT